MCILGIVDSKGVIYDFAGPYTIGRGKLAFGKATRYILLDKTKCTLQDWDTSIADGNTIYSKRMHNLLLDNCHSHCAKCLNIMGYGGKTDYNMLTIGTWVFFQGKFCGKEQFIKTYLPFVVLLLFLCWFGGLWS